MNSNNDQAATPLTNESDFSPTNLGPRSTLISRNITIDSHRTSVRLEPEMWAGLREICRREHVSLHTLCTEIAERKPANSSLTAAIRVFIMAYFRAAATEDGHSKAGHGPGGYFMSASQKSGMLPATGRTNHSLLLMKSPTISGSKG